MKKLIIKKPNGTELVYIEGQDGLEFGDLLIRANEAFDNEWDYKWL